MDIESSAADREVLGDASRLAQGFGSLIDNAVEFNREDGSVAVRIENPSAARIRQASASAELREAIERWAMPAYRALEAHRARGIAASSAHPASPSRVTAATR
jgi:hypothetical protein